MAEPEGESFFKGDHLLTEGNPPSFSELLFSNDDDDHVDVGVDMEHAFRFSSIEKPPRMLCFGGYSTYQNESEIAMFSEATKTTPQLSGVTCSDSSSASSGNNNCNSATVNVISTDFRSNKKRDGSSQEVPVKSTNTMSKTTPLPSQRTSKKTKTENPRSTGNAKVKREKLGDRITALQQLVSPFGKTDTASVLHEAMGYIRFLQDQVKVLCSPYLQNLPEGGENGGEESIKNLRSRGLCLVPVDCTVHVASSNGADYWSPATVGNNISSFSSSKR